MTLFRFTVSYEGEIEAPDPDSARSWALEEVEAGHFLPVIVEAVPVPRESAGTRSSVSVPGARAASTDETDPSVRDSQTESPHQEGNAPA